MSLNDLMPGQYQLSCEQTKTLLEAHTHTKEYSGRAVIEPAKSKIWLPVGESLTILIMDFGDEPSQEWRKQNNLSTAEQIQCL